MPRPQRTPGPAVLNPDTPGAESVAIEALFRSLQYDPREVIKPLEDPGKVAEQAIELAGDLRKYIKWSWPLVEPNTFVPN